MSWHCIQASVTCIVTGIHRDGTRVVSVYRGILHEESHTLK